MQLSAKVYDTEISTEILKYEHVRVRTGVGRLSVPAGTRVLAPNCKQYLEER